jgi:hypothetical protein
MATPARISTFRIVVDGEWDIEDLRHVSESLSETYGLFYPLVADDEVVRERLQDSLRHTFWSGDVDSRFIGQRLYRQIPSQEGLKLRSFQYSSQGAMTFVGVLGVLLVMARVSNAWLKVGDAFIKLWAKVDKFFAERPHLRRTRKNFELEDEIRISADEARILVFEVGGTLGFTPSSCDVLIATVGNPIAALKFLVAVGKEGRKLANLQKEGKLQLPAPTGDEIELKPSASSKKRMKGQVEVVRRRRRKKKD